MTLLKSEGRLERGRVCGASAGTTTAPAGAAGVTAR